MSGWYIVIILVLICILAPVVRDLAIAGLAGALAVMVLRMIRHVPRGLKSAGNEEDTIILTDSHNVIPDDRQFKIVSTKTGGAIISKEMIRAVLLASKSLIHVSASTSAAVVTVGLGGDSIVDAIFLVMSAGEFAARIGLFIGSTFGQLRDLAAVGFAGGVSGVRAAAEHISKLTSPAACDHVNANINIVIEVAMSVLGVFVPDDMGLLGTFGGYMGVIGKAVIGSPIWLDAVEGVYGLIPEHLRIYLTDKQKFKSLLLLAITFIQENIIAAGATMRQKISLFSAGAIASAGAAGAGIAGIIFPPMVPAALTTSATIQAANIYLTTESGRQHFRDILDELRPQVDLVVDVAHQSLALLFGIPVIVQNCVVVEL